MVDIYVICASQGEYSDRSEWRIRAVRDEDEAKQLVVDLDRASKEVAAKVKAYRAEHKTPNHNEASWQTFDWAAYGDGIKALGLGHPDPKFDASDWDEATYWYEQLELV